MGNSVQTLVFCENKGCGTSKKYPKKPCEEAGGASQDHFNFGHNVHLTETDGEVRDQKFLFAGFILSLSLME